MRGQAMLLAGALFAFGAVAPAEAQARGYGQPQYGQSGYVDPYCAQQRQNRMLTGAAIGAVAGAVLGNNLAARNAQSEGSILGGVAGAAAGAAIGRSTANCNRTVQSGYGYGSSYGGQPYRQSDYGYGYGAPAPLAGGPGYRVGHTTYGYGGAPGYGYGEPECRWGEESVRDPDGRTFRQSVYMCRGTDGVWRKHP